MNVVSPLCCPTSLFEILLEGFHDLTFGCQTLEHHVEVQAEVLFHLNKNGIGMLPIGRAKA